MFVRYNENGNHIRLRLRLNDPATGYQLTGNLSEALKDEIESGIIADLRINIYRREVERYGFANMEMVEEHFSTDSTFVMQLLSADLNTFARYKLCSRIIKSLVIHGIIEEGELHTIVSRNSEAFNKEHSLMPEDFKKLNKEFNSYLNQPADLLPPGLEVAWQAFENSLIRVLSNCPHENRDSFFTDLLHMHVNRMFCDHQRSHEMVLYYFQVKALQRKNAMR